MKYSSMIIAVIVFSCLFSVFTSAEIFHYGIDNGFKYNSHVKRHVYIINYVGKKRNVTIPKKVDGLKVKSMDGFGRIEKLHIPAGVEVSNLPYAKKLKKITVSKKHKKYSVRNNLLLNKKRTTLISSLKNNKNPIIPKSVKRIGDKAFASSKIKEFTLPDHINSINNAIFVDCKKLESVSLHEKILDLPDGLFSECKNLKNYTINENVRTIGGSVFNNCQSLEKINIPNSVRKIGEYAFQGCKSIKEITIPFKVTKLGSGTFANCSSLENITFNNNLKVLDGYSMIDGCKKLKVLHIPKSVNFIGHDTLYSKYLKKIYIYNKNCEINFAIENKVVYIERPAIHPDTTIYGYKGSTAEKYAKKNGNKFVVLN